VEPVKAGLVRDDGRLFYPVIDDIPVMLKDEAIVITGGPAGMPESD
jgi:uncharacterized protein YbaR (Trm112 family)